MKNLLARLALPSLFVSSVIVCVIRQLVDIYNSVNFLFYGVGTFIATFVLQFVTDKISKKSKLLTTLFVLLLLSICGYLGWQALTSFFYGGEMAKTPSQWLFTAKAEDGIEPYQSYFLALFVFAVVFLGLITYYFNNVRYRSIGNMTIILFAMTIYAKRAEHISSIDFFLMLLLYVANLVHNRQKALSKQNVKIVFNRSYIICITVFAAIASLIGSLMQKPDYQSQLELDPTMLDIESSLEKYPEYNFLDNASFGLSKGTGNSPLFTLFCSDPNISTLYLHSQSFESFDGRQWNFYNDGESNDYSLEGTEKIESFSSEISHSSIHEYYNSYGFENSDHSDYHPANVRIEIYYEENVTPFNIVPTPVEINSIMLSEQTVGNAVWRPFMGYLYAPYSTEVSLSVEPETTALHEAAKQSVPFEEYMRKISEDYNKYVYNQAVYINEHFTGKNDVISDEAKQLAQDITKDCTTEYDKAQAIVNYFNSNGFIYDTEAENKSVDEFLFENKSGACVEYATSMTLMARSVGLPARYTQGFLAVEKNSDGNFIVREKHAHAFVEVYFPSVGWVTFEPTVAGFIEQTAPKNKTDMSAFIISLFKNIAIAVFTLLGVCFLIVFINVITPKIKLKLDTLKLKPQQLCVFYCKKIQQDINKTSLSPRQLKQEVWQLLEMDISCLTDSCESVLYSSNPQNPDARMCSQCYKEFSKKLSEKAKQERKAKKIKH